MLFCQFVDHHKDCLLPFGAVAPVRLMDLRSARPTGQVRPEPGEAPGFVASAEAVWQVSPRERTFRFAAHLGVRLSFVARCFHCSNYYAKLVGNCKIYFHLFSLAHLRPKLVGLLYGLLDMQPQKHNNLGGFCEQCGGTGRSETGCQPCSYCNGKGLCPFRELYASMIGRMEMKPTDPPTHKHRCPDCGYIWEHETNCSEVIIRSGVSPDNKKQHTCSKCGAESWEWYKGSNAGVFQSCAAI